MKRAGCTLVVVLVATASIVAWPQASFAEPPKGESTPASVERAGRLKQQGDEALLNLRYADALRAYEESFRIVPNPALHYNRGRAFEALERLSEAIAAYELFLAQAPAELRAKTPTLAAHVAELRQRTAALTVVVDVEGARVLLRGAVLGVTPLKPTRVLAGTGVLEVEADGYAPYKTDVTLPGGGELTVRARLVQRVTSAATAPTPTAPAEPEHDSAPVTKTWWFWTGLGVLVAGGATATVLVLTSKSDPAPRSGTLGTVTGPLLRF